ncbi:MAG: HD domain-containing protein [Tannerellaceae bacterium]|jgi:uncharacterized protein|nr:HD domain-containing protein [Tannerellaceae bacterium]
MNILELIYEFYPKGSASGEILISHSRDVTAKALEIAGRHPQMNIDIRFVEEAAMLHDIGIYLCHAPEISCHGDAGYICHGYLGADILRSKGLHRHALVCERHTGSGITLEEIKSRNLPVPQRNMLPVSIEEQLICYADKFFSKTDLGREKPFDKVIKSLSKHGGDTLDRFHKMHILFA